MTQSRPLYRPRLLSSLTLSALSLLALSSFSPPLLAQPGTPPVLNATPTEAPLAPPAPALTDTPASPPVAMPTPPPSVPPQPEEAAATVVAQTASGEPLAGVSDGSMFLRSPDGSFVFFPEGRLQIDGYVFHSDDKVPNNGFLLKRARLALGGWIGSWVYFTLQGDFATNPATATAAPAPASPANLATTDNYIALVPHGTIAMLQVGQFDAPFTLENRISDKYFDFVERSITVRAFGIPTNKEVGAMLHGWNEPRNFAYFVGLFNGDGQNFRNVDNQFDWMGRAWIAPFSFSGDGPLHDVEVGGSFWTGDRVNTQALPSQQTLGGFTFLTFTSGMNPLRQVGRMNAAAAELNAPIAHKYGLRGEFVWKHSPLSVESVASNGAGTILGGANLKGWSVYGEAWLWALGDDRIIGDQQGLQAYPRFKKFGVKPLQHGLMLALRIEYLDEDLTPEGDALTSQNSAFGKTKVNSYQLGVNYWHSKRFRATFNYVFNHFTGTTAQITALPSANEQELLFRLGIAL